MDPDVLSVPADLAERVAYQAGSVVSRTLLKIGSGSLTLFAFDEGQGLSEHTTPHVAVVLILDGSARVTIAEREILVGEGEAVSLPAGVPHALYAPEPFKMLLVMLKQAAEEPSA